MSVTPQQGTHGEPLDELPIPFVTRKTPVLLLLRVILLSLLINGAYILLRLVVPPSEASFNVDSFPFFTLFFAAQVVGVGLLVWRWARETYEIHQDDLHHNRGIIFRKEETYPYNNMQTVTCFQSPIGRIYHYGEVRLFIPTLGRELVFTEVPHPHHFIQTVRHVLPYPDKQKFIIQG